MSILKLLPLVYVVAKASATWLPPDLPPQNEDFKNCLCPSKHPTIIDTLDKDPSGIERQVVFLYRKPNTNEIISFVPHKEVQRKIPDFPDHYGNIIENDQNLPMKHYFDNHFPKKYDVVETVKQPESIEGFVAEKPKVLDAKDSDLAWQLPIDEAQKKLYVQPVPVENAPKKTEILIDGIKNPVDDSKSNPNKDLTIDGTPAYPYEIFNPHEEQIFPGKSLKYDIPKTDSSSIQTISVQPVPKDLGTIYSIPERIPTPLNENFNIITDWHPKTLNNYCKKCIKTYKWLKSQNDRHKSSLAYYHNNGHVLGEKPFGYWLKQQLKINPINGHRIPTSRADILALDAAIRKILLQKGWIVQENGKLISRYGQTSRLDNLKLQPILIGQPVSYNSFINTHKFHSPTKSSYSEAMLLRMIDPAIILGIVPFSTSYQHSHDPYTVGEGSITSDELGALLQRWRFEELMSKKQTAQFQTSPLDQLVLKQPQAQIQVSPLQQLMPKEPSAQIHVSPLEQLVLKQPQAQIKISPIEQLMVKQPSAQIQVSPFEQLVLKEPSARIPVPAPKQIFLKEPSAQIQVTPFEQVVLKQPSAQFQVSPLEQLVFKEPSAQIQVLPLEQLKVKGPRARIHVSPLEQLMFKEPRGQIQVSPLEHIVLKEPSAQIQVSPLEQLMFKEPRAQIQVSPLEQLMFKEPRAQIQVSPLEQLVLKQPQTQIHVSPLENIMSEKQRAHVQISPLTNILSFRKGSQNLKSDNFKVSSNAKSKDTALLMQALSKIHASQSGKGGKTVPRGRGKVKYVNLGNHRTTNEEKPGWRIIGGVSAVGSGTPLDLKGRSGDTI